MRSSTLDRLRPWLTLAAIVATLAVNTYTNLAPPTGVNIGQLANTVFASVAIIPANYAFAIWGLIYLGLIALGIYQLRSDQRQNPDLRITGYGLIIACLSQIAWVYLFLYRQFWWSVLAMLGILLPLIYIYLKLGIGQRPVSRADRWYVHYPISIYLGWISVATVVNVASALYDSGWQGGGLSTEVWTVLLAGVATLLGGTLVLQRRDRAYPLVIVWALVAIGIKQMARPVIALPVVGMVVILVLLVLWSGQQKVRTQQE